MNSSKFLIIAGIVFVVGIGGLFALSTLNNKPAQNTIAALPQETNTLGAQTPSTATLEIFSGSVFVVAPGTTERKAAVDKQSVTEGTKISTGEGGRAQVLYSNHTVTRLDTNTEITLKKLNENPAQVDVTLTKSRIWSRIAKLLGQESYQTETTTVVATVRGTSYGMGILPDGTTKITTTKGNVDATCTEKANDQIVGKDHIFVFNCADETTNKTDINLSTQDDWFRFNQDEDKKLNERFGKDIYKDDDVLGATTDVLGDSTTPAPQPLAILPECVGPDGKIAHASKADCDALWAFWNAHPPAGHSDNNNSSNNNSSSSDTSNNQPAASPDVAPSPSASGSGLTNTVPSPSPSGPTISNVTYSPNVYNDHGTTCNLNLGFNVTDATGVSTVSVDWYSVDAQGAISTPTTSVPITTFTPPVTDLTLNPSVVIQVPAFGTLFWSINATNVSGNNGTFTGTPVNETMGASCSAALAG